MFPTLELKQRHVRKGVRPNCHYNKVILFTLNFLINLYQHLCLPCARRVFLSGKCLNWNIMQWVVATRANALQKNKNSSSTRIKEVVHWKASQGWQPKDNNHRMFNNGKFWDCVIFFFFVPNIKFFLCYDVASLHLCVNCHFIEKGWPVLTRILASTVRFVINP